MTTTEQVKRYFSESGLSDGFIIEDYEWSESGGHDHDAYMVFSSGTEPEESMILVVMIFHCVVNFWQGLG